MNGPTKISSLGRIISAVLISSLCVSAAQASAQQIPIIVEPVIEADVLEPVLDDDVSSYAMEDPADGLTVEPSLGVPELKIPSVVVAAQEDLPGATEILPEVDYDESDLDIAQFAEEQAAAEHVAAEHEQPSSHIVTSDAEQLPSDEILLQVKPTKYTVTKEDIAKQEQEALAAIERAYQAKIAEIEAQYQASLQDIGEISATSIEINSVDVIKPLEDVADTHPTIENELPAVKSGHIPTSPKEVFEDVTAGSLQEEDPFLIRNDVEIKRGEAGGGVLPLVSKEELDSDYRVERGIAVREATEVTIEDDEQLFEYLKLAHFSLSNGKNKEAIVHFRQAIDLQDSYEARFGLATAYHADGQFDFAKKLYLELVHQDSSDWRVLNNLILLVGETASDEALAQLQQLEQFNSEFAAIPAHMALLYIEREEWNFARAKLIRAIQLEPGNLHYRYNLAILSEKMGKMKDAVKIYQQLLFASRQGKELPLPATELQSRIDYLASRVIFKQ